MQVELAIKSKNIVTPSEIIDGMILISNGKIADIISTVSYDEKPEASLLDFPIEDAGDSIVMPGIIDPHVHINEPGRTGWEGFETATAAAAAGGITTLVDMPLNSSPVTTTKENLLRKIRASDGKLFVNCGFWGGVIPGNENDLEDLLDAGAAGLKVFLTHSGIDEFPNAGRAELQHAMKLLSRHGKPLLVHCELGTSDQTLLKKDPGSYRTWLQSRPRTMEDDAIKLVIDLCRETKARVHIVHLSSSDSLEQISKAKEEGLPLTVETAPHYLYFNSENIPDRDPRFKCAPPIREKENNEKLWQALKDGIIDFIATDHSPAPPELKEIESGNIAAAWGGIAGLQFSLPVTWTGALERNFSISEISKWLCENPARFLRLDSKKGKVAKGFDADLCIWNPAAKFTVTEGMIRHRHKITPYLGEELFGIVKQTYLDGNCIFSKDTLNKQPAGRCLLANYA